MWIYLFIFILIIISLYLIYTYYKKNKNKKKFVENKEFIERDNVLKGDIYIFYAKWCPYSKKALEKIDNIENEYKNTKYSLQFTKIDSDKNIDLADKYNIEEYPSIILLYNNKTYIYDAELDNNTFNKFIETIMN